MNQAQKKHQKKLGRQKKLSKRQERDLPFRIKIHMLDFDRKGMRNFEEAALQRLNLKDSIKQLYKDDTFRHSLKLETNDQISICLKMLAKDQFKRHSSVPPLFIPVWGLKMDDSILHVGVKIVRPERLHIPTRGSAYSWGHEIRIKDKTHELWFLDHALDRMEERLELKKDESDIGCWLNILASKRSNERWKYLEIENTKFIVFSANVQGQVIDVAMMFCPYFLWNYKGRDIIIAQTVLLPGMKADKFCFTIPNPHKEELKLLFKTICDQWRRFWDPIHDQHMARLRLKELSKCQEVALDVPSSQVNIQNLLDKLTKSSTSSHSILPIN